MKWLEKKMWINRREVDMEGYLSFGVPCHVCSVSRRGEERNTKTIKSEGLRRKFLLQLLSFDMLYIEKYLVQIMTSIQEIGALEPT